MITSSQNPKLQRIRALLGKRKQREEELAFVIEGVRLVEEGLISGWQAEIVLYSSRLSLRGRDLVKRCVDSGIEILEVEDRLFDGISGTETSQGLMAIFRQSNQIMPENLDFVLIADNIRDPGNMGTLLRSAAAAGVQSALLSPGTTDVFAPKVLRAGMGAHFHLTVIELSWNDIRAVCLEKGLRVLLAESSNGISCWDINLLPPTAIIVSSEADGASAEAMALSLQPIHIPMPGKSESLNASVAASILFFEVVRQRRMAGTQERKTDGS